MGKDKRPSFFKIVFAGASNERLRIPSDFLKHISNEVSDRATLKVGSGCSWNAKVSKKSNGVFIEDGWPEFLKDNFLGNNEFLVLTYAGNMCFGIQIFEVNGLERLNVPLTRKHQVPFASTSSKRLQRKPKHSTTTTSQPLASTNTTQKPRARPRKHQPCTQHLPPSPKSCEEDGSGKNHACFESSKATKSKAEKGKEIEIEPEDEDQPLPSLSKDDQARGQKATESFKSKFPHFTSHVQKYHVYVPAFFSKAHLRRQKYEMVLRNLKGNSWVVKVVPTSQGHVLCGGWRAFAKHNKVKNNVVCIFELVDRLEMKRIPSDFLKHISNESSDRATLTVCSGRSWNAKVNGLERLNVPLMRTNQVPFDSTSSAEKPESRPRKHRACTTSSQPLASTSNIAKRPESGPRKHKACTTSQPLASTRIAKRLQSRQRKQHTCPVNLHPSPKSCEEDGSGSNIACSESNKSHPKFKATKGKEMKIELEDEDQAVRFLSKDDMSRDQKAAHSFKTKFPHFKHPVRKYHVHVPKFFSKAHLRREKHEIVLRNLQGKSWVVTAVPTQNAHTLYGGWSGFVVDNKLNHNDVCIFELVGTQEMKVPKTLKVHNVNDRPIIQLVLLVTNYNDLLLLAFTEFPFQYPGCSWNAKVSETSSSGIFIEDGWHQFLKDNSLGNNEFLLFTYEGNMCFNVQIFEVNGCERLNLPLIGTHELSASTSTKTPRGRPRKHPASTVHLSPTLKPCEDGSGERLKCCESDEPKKFKAEEGNYKRVEPEEAHPVHFLSEDDLARNLKAAESFESKFPHFSSPVRRNTMYVSKSFSKEHLCHKRCKYVLRNLEGKSWVVNISCSRWGCFFCGGWSRFVDDNKLEQDDVCIFELVDRLEMRVHIFRKGPGNQSSANSTM
ncbi:hypothetical protein FNV43_RR22763 [Rhamnella rubrinervis]|uniref:TF-B3 domain-containing protein n=1 Tax=Rhamnella rubrinervis TaxID=2594499 RepID=A0A8K0GNH8_9ROSA|nr:hypothetical protein FNV43_RR22763 [Rhamnella rubrinervis]